MKMPKEHRGWDESRSPQWRYLNEQEHRSGSLGSLYFAIRQRLANQTTRSKPQR